MIVRKSWRQGRQAGVPRWWGVAGVIMAAGIIAAACGGGGSAFEDARLQRFDDELTSAGQPHIPAGQRLTYPTSPPYGGPHAEIPIRCGLYQEQQSFEGLLHTMEHGGVILYYHPDLFTTDELNALRVVALPLLQDDLRIVLTPHREIDGRLVLASWGRLLRLEQTEEETIRGFVEAFENRGPERIPRSNAC